MKIKWAVLCCCAMLLAGSAVTAQEQGYPEGVDPAEMAKMHEAMMKAGEPGEKHEILAMMEGEWKVTSKFYMPGAKEPTISEGVSRNRMILGQRFLLQKYEADFMGHPFKGIGYTGYDNLQGKYVLIWMDNMGTAIMIGHAQDDGKGKVIIGTLEYIDPLTEEKKATKTVTRIIDENKHVFEMYERDERGEEKLHAKMVYTRVK